MPTDASEKWWLQWESMGEPPTLAGKIVKAVLRDLAGRRGIKWELEKVDVDVIPMLLFELGAVVQAELVEPEPVGEEG